LLVASCRIELKGIIELAELLKSNKSIMEIHIGWNPIGDEGISKICESLKSNNTLAKLSVWNNPIGNKGANELLQTIKSNNFALKEIYLGNQNNIDEKLVEEIRKELENPQRKQKLEQFRTQQREKEVER